MSHQELLEQIYFDICDLLEGGVPFGYKTRKECLQNIKEALEEIGV